MMDLLACPGCGSPFEPGEGLLRCRCGAYPVVGGIPVLTEWARGKRFTTEELLSRFRPPASTWAAKILRRLGSDRRRLRTLIGDPGATFLSLVSTLRRTADLDYFRYRFSGLSYLAFAALLTVARESPVLDLCCGTGHFERALALRLPADRLVGLDFNFTLLYLAKRFLAPRSQFVCADASSRLPFRDGAFGTGICLDSFAYLPDRSGAARELMRVARGAIVVAPLGDPAYRRGGALPPPAPEACLDLFRARNPHLHSQSHILESFLRTRNLDLSRPASPADTVLALVAGVEPGVYPGADYFVRGSTLNPIYEVREEGTRLHLKRRPLDPEQEAVLRQYEAYLPGEWVVEKERVEKADPELVRRFVLLDLPERYG